MLIGIDSLVFDVDGSFMFDIDEKESIIQDAIRRVSRTATLDGNAAVVDCGFSHGDREIFLVFDTDQETIDRLWSFLQTYSEMALTLPDGVYNASIQNYSNRFGQVNLRIFIESSL